jgi:GAF domain-containing protein
VIPQTTHPQSRERASGTNSDGCPGRDVGSGIVAGMPMRATTVRFSEDLWRMLERESRRDGISSAQFVRDATILRIAFLAAGRGDPEAQGTLAQVAAGALADRARTVPVAVREPERVAAVRATGLLEAREQASLDRLAGLAARILDAPIALVSLIDRDRQVFAGCVGLDEPWAGSRETPLSHSLCQHAVASREPLVVPDVRRHPLLRESLAIRDLGAIAYAGIPLITEAGHALGTLCAMDHRPRAWTAEEVGLLRDVAAAALSEIRLLGFERR